MLCGLIGEFADETEYKVKIISVICQGYDKKTSQMPQYFLFEVLQLQNQISIIV